MSSKIVYLNNKLAVFGVRLARGFRHGTVRWWICRLDGPDIVELGIAANGQFQDSFKTPDGAYRAFRRLLEKVKDAQEQA